MCGIKIVAFPLFTFRVKSLQLFLRPFVCQPFLGFLIILMTLYNVINWLRVWVGSGNGSFISINL